MATTFEVTVVHEDRRYARQAAEAAFAELDLVETRLSRFIEGSDVFRLSRLGAGQSTVVSLDTFRCLQLALDIQRQTSGAFDVTYASAPVPPETERIRLCEEDMTVRVLADGVRPDLGGIGKGLSLDRMAEVLAEWDIESALLCASTSTLLALGPPPGELGWPVRLEHDDDGPRTRLAHRALSGSGIAVRGHHIIEPRAGRPAMHYQRAWAAAPTATVADALSTAFMVMTEPEIQQYCRGRPEVAGGATPLREPSPCTAETS